MPAKRLGTLKILCFLISGQKVIINHLEKLYYIDKIFWGRKE